VPAILFDLDGTLVDSLSDIAGAVNHMRGLHRLSPLPLGTVRKFIGRGLEHLVRQAFPELNPEQSDELIEKYRSYYHEHACSTGTLYPGVRETLEALRQKPGLKLAIVTNKPSLIADKTLAHYLPGFYFDAVAGPERVAERKPSPRHLLDVLARLEVAPADAWYVGDHPVDEQCARAAGVRFLGAGYGFGGIKIDDARMLQSFAQILVKAPV